MVELKLSELFLLPGEHRLAEQFEILCASREGDVNKVRRLLPRVRKPAEVRDWDGKTLLHYSCRHGWLDVTRRLVQQYHFDPESKANVRANNIFEDPFSPFVNKHML